MNTKKIIKIINEKLTKYYRFAIDKTFIFNAYSKRRFAELRTLNKCNYDTFKSILDLDVSYYIYKQVQKQLNQFFI